MDDTEPHLRVFVDASLYLLRDTIRLFNGRTSRDFDMQSRMDRLWPDIFRTQVMDSKDAGHR